jgi:hypothetical protein
MVLLPIIRAKIHVSSASFSYGIRQRGYGGSSQRRCASDCCSLPSVSPLSDSISRDAEQRQKLLPAIFCPSLSSRHSPLTGCASTTWAQIAKQHPFFDKRHRQLAVGTQSADQAGDRKAGGERATIRRAASLRGTSRFPVARLTYQRTTRLPQCLCLANELRRPSAAAPPFWRNRSGWHRPRRV